MVLGHRPRLDQKQDQDLNQAQDQDQDLTGGVFHPASCLDVDLSLVPDLHTESSLVYSEASESQESQQE